MTLHWSDTGVEVHKVVVGPVENNVFVIRCTSTGEAVLIDAANEHERLLELCRGLGVRTVLENPRPLGPHPGHSGGARGRLRGGGDARRTRPLLPSYDYLLEDDTVVEVGRLRLRTLHTPGHTPGSMSFHVEGTPLLFTGDTLFPGGPGATQYGGDFATIIGSIEGRIFSKFDGSTIVLPGHGLDTTLGTESPHLDEWVARGW